MRGVFIFRYELGSVARQLDPNNPLVEGGPLTPVVYRLNLSDPNSLFMEQSFRIANRDVIYVSNSPSTELQKVFGIVSRRICANQRGRGRRFSRGIGRPLTRRRDWSFSPDGSQACSRWRFECRDPIIVKATSSRVGAGIARPFALGSHRGRADCPAAKRPTNFVDKIAHLYYLCSISSKERPSMRSIEAVAPAAAWNGLVGAQRACRRSAGRADRQSLEPRRFGRLRCGAGSGLAGKWRRNGLKILNPRREMVWPGQLRSPRYLAPARRRRSSCRRIPIASRRRAGSE